MSIVLKTPSNGSVTLAEQDTASNVTVTVPARTANVMLDGPAFSAYASAATSCANNAFTKILFATEEYDTNNCFSASRFTPNVAGYYQVNASINIISPVAALLIAIAKNGSEYKRGVWANTATLNTVSMSGLVYCNGSTDYIEIFIYQNSGNAVNTSSGSNSVWFDGFLARGA